MSSYGAFGRLGIYFLCIVMIYNNFAIGSKSIFEQAESELTITINPGSSECFFQKGTVGEVIELEYQVIDASFGDVEINQDLDISFHLYSPKGRELIADYKQSDAMHRHEVKEEGDFKFCFDNSFSHFSTKTVYFEIYVESDMEEDDRWDNLDVAFSPELLYNDTMDQIKISIGKVRDFLTKVKHHQDQVRAIESRDRNLQEHNFTRVNQFSMLIIVVMMVVGAVQVLMLRSLFEEKSKLHKIFKLLS